MLKYTPPQLQAHQSKPWQEWQVMDFSGGLCTAYPEDSLADNQFPVFTNFYITNTGAIKTRGPYRPYGIDTADIKLVNGASATVKPESIFLASVSGTDKVLACWLHASSDYRVASWSGSAWGSAIASGLGAKAQFSKFSVNEADDVIICNGSDAPKRWTGSGSASNLGLAAPSLTANLDIAEDNTSRADTRGIQNKGTYYYKFTYFYDDSGNTTKYGESGPSTTTSVLLSNASETNPVAVAIDLDTDGDGDGDALPSGVSKLMVYRSPPDQQNGPFRYVGFSTSEEFSDNTPVGEEGIECPIDNGTPPTTLKNILVSHGRIWGIGGLDNKLVCSAVGQPDYFPTLNAWYFPDEIIGPVEFKENVYIFTRKQVYVFPNGDLDTYPQPLKVCDKGATSHKSIVDVGNGLVFQGEDNIYWVNFNTRASDGDFPIPIGDPIRNYIELTTAAQRENSVACMHKNRYYLSFTSAGTENTMTVVWDIIAGTRLLSQGMYGGWSQVDWSACDMIHYKGKLYTADNVNKYLMEHDFIGVDDIYVYGGDSQPIQTILNTRPLYLGSEWYRKMIKSVSVSGQSSGVAYYANLEFDGGDHLVSLDFTMGTSEAGDEDSLIWGFGLWNEKNWAEATSSYRIAHKKSRDARGRRVKVQFGSLDSQDTSITMLKLYYTVLATAQ